MQFLELRSYMSFWFRIIFVTSHNSYTGVTLASVVIRSWVGFTILRNINHNHSCFFVYAELPQRNIRQYSGCSFVDSMASKRLQTRKSVVEHFFPLKCLHLDALSTLYLLSKVNEWAKDGNNMERKSHRSTGNYHEMNLQREEHLQNNHIPSVKKLCWP